MNNYQRQFIAGLFDTDGCFYAVPSKNATSIKFANRSQDLIDYIARFYTGSQSTWYNIAGNLAHEFRIAAAERAIFLKDISPYLISKRDQAELLAEYVATIGPGGKAVSPEVKARRNEIARKIKALKREHTSPPGGPVPTDAYLAGAIEGDGSIGIQKHQRLYRAEVVVSNYDRTLTGALYEKYGGVLCEKSWRVYGRDALRILDLISPYLISYKKDRAEVVRSFLTLQADFYSRGIPYSDEVIKLFEMHYQDCKKLGIDKWM